MRFYISCLAICLCLAQTVFGATFTCDLFASCGCSTVSTVTVNAKIVGGEVAASRVWGWMVSLQFGGSHRCGASLLSADSALTAAHCIDDLLQNPSSLSIVAGTNSLPGTGNPIVQTRTIASIVIHPNYNSNTNQNDIAILRFSALTVSSATTLSFVCLPTANQDPFVDGDDLIAIGWGATVNGGSSSSSLRQVTLKAIPSSNTACRNFISGNENVMLCAGIAEGGKDTCQGDSGGPLLAFKNNLWVVAGITSFGPECGLANSAGVYTRVSSFIPFITSAQGGSVTTDPTITSTVASGSGGSAGGFSGKINLSISFFIALMALFFRN